MGVQHKAIKMTRAHVRWGSELALLTPAKKQPRKQEQPTTTWRAVTEMAETNSSLQWQARQQWPQIEAWEVPAGHEKKLPHWEVVQHWHRLARGAEATSIRGFRDLVRHGHSRHDLLVRALLQGLCRSTNPTRDLVISWAPPRSFHRNQWCSFQPQYQIFSFSHSKFQYYTKGISAVDLPNFPNKSYYIQISSNLFCLCNKITSRKCYKTHTQTRPGLKQPGPLQLPSPAKDLHLTGFSRSSSSSCSPAGVTDELPSSSLHGLQPFRRYSSITDVQQLYWSERAATTLYQTHTS